MSSFLWTRCATYDLTNHSKSLLRVEVRSPVSVYVIFHDKDQISLPRELSAYQLFDKQHVIEVTIEKTIDLNQKEKPCYYTSENDKESFGEHDYKLLINKIMQKFECTTLYIPAEFINGSKICQNSTTTNLVHEFMKYSSPTFATNLWTSDYYSPPPCVYHKYSVDQTIAGKGK